MEVGQDKGIDIGKNPFYQPSNSLYGQGWLSSDGKHPINIEQIPQYNDVVSIPFEIAYMDLKSILCNSLIIEL